MRNVAEDDLSHTDNGAKIVSRMFCGTAIEVLDDSEGYDFKACREQERVNLGISTQSRYRSSFTAG